MIREDTQVRRPRSSRWKEQEQEHAQLEAQQIHDGRETHRLTTTAITRPRSTLRLSRSADAVPGPAKAMDIETSTPPMANGNKPGPGPNDVHRPRLD